MKTPGLGQLEHALHYTNELLVRVSLAFQKLLQTRQTSRLSKQVLVMIKHCLGNSQINSIPPWSKEFSYITFLYRTNANVYAYNESEQILFIHSAKLTKFLTLKTHLSIN